MVVAGGGHASVRDLECGSTERFLADLLFIALSAKGLDISREFPLGGGSACDLVIHGEDQVFIELKQLHLKDGWRFASNVSRDLSRHRGHSALGTFCRCGARRQARFSSYL